MWTVGFAAAAVLLLVLPARWVGNLWFHRARIEVDRGTLIYRSGWRRLRERWRLDLAGIADLSVEPEVGEPGGESTTGYYDLVLRLPDGSIRKLIPGIESKDGALRIREAMLASLRQSQIA